MKSIYNQLSSSTTPIYVRSVRLTLTAPLSQLDALRLPLSLLPTPAALAEDGPDPAPSSKSVHGSNSISMSSCDDGNGFVFSDTEVADLVEET